MGTQGAQSAKAASNTRQNIFRFYNTTTQVHFFTMSASERDYVKANIPSFRDEGIGFFAYPNPDPVLSPVHRFYNHVTGGHFYTINPAEKDHVIATWPTIFNYEGIAWYASTTKAANLIPIYRFFNTKTGAHFYTSSASEKDHVLATWNWFTYEGIAYYVGETAADPVVPPVVVPDTTPPVITVLGTNPLSPTVGTAYTEAGATCVDNKDPTCTVVTTGAVNTAAAGSYTITYTATDAAGNTSTSTRTVHVTALIVPTVSFAQTSYDALEETIINNPLITNSLGTVTYASSNTAIATVNATTGQVTILPYTGPQDLDEFIGTVTITATQAATPSFAATSASYVINVTCNGAGNILCGPQ